MIAEMVSSVELIKVDSYDELLEAIKKASNYNNSADINMFRNGLDREKNAADGSFKIVYLGDGRTGFRLELTWMRDQTQPYNLGDEEFHLAFVTDEIDAFHDRHAEMGCICYENPSMGVYFINDPDGYWVEIIPQKSR